MKSRIPSSRGNPGVGAPQPLCFRTESEEVTSVATPDAILEGLNPNQQDAARAVRGPLIILAGAGSGKTTTVTRRIAYQVATETFRPESILAVAFTRKARTEMRQRLSLHRITAVNVLTIHAAAYQQLRWSGIALPPLLDEGDKQELMKTVISNVAPDKSGVYRKDVITVIERAKGSGVTAANFERFTSSWPLPLDAKVMSRVYAEYERLKSRSGRIDFEDMQRLALDAMRGSGDHAAQFHKRIHAITVDEFQDVNELQVDLIDAWLGQRDDICVVGDDYQAIYGFRGGSPEFLLGWERRYPHARRVLLDSNYRSTPEILGVANRLVPWLGGQPKQLRPTKPSGPQPLLREVRDEPAFVVDNSRRLNAVEGVPFEQIAVLVRVNRSTARFEEAFASARIPYRVEEGGFLQRPAIAVAIRVLQRDQDAPVTSAVETAASAGGLRSGETTQGEHAQDLALLVDLAREFVGSQPQATVRTFLADLEQRFRPTDDAAEGRGVRLMTYHQAKGLEFDGVFLPRLTVGELPYRSGRSEAPIDEERRLLYMGITRARKYLFITREGPASSFWQELLPAIQRPVAVGKRQSLDRDDEGDVEGSMLTVLVRWRERLYRQPRFSTFQDHQLKMLADATPTDVAALGAIVGPDRAEKYGGELVRLIARKLERDRTS